MKKSLFTLFILCLLSTQILAKNTTTFATPFEKEPLIVANYPEKIHHPGTILKHRLTLPSIRLLYYYQNVTKKSLWLNLLVTNQSSTTANIKVLKGTGGPVKDGLFAGHKASNTFLKNLLDSQYISYMILPHSSVQIEYHKLKPSMVSAGLFRVENLSQTALQLELQATEPSYSQLTEFIPSSDMITKYKYIEIPNALIQKRVQFSTQHLLKEITIGRTPSLRDIRNNQLLKRHYGVMYEIKVTLSNPSIKYEKVQLLFSRISGISRGTFLLNNQLISTKFVNINRNHDPEKLKTFTLKPKSNQSFTLLFIPQAGSFYPIKLVLKRISASST